MNEILRQVLAGLLGGLMASGTATIAVLQETRLAEVMPGQWVIIAIGGFLAAGAAWKTLLSAPPKR